MILQYMHSEGWIYRDLKASNIIINKNGKVTLIDLGFSKNIEKERWSSINYLLRTNSFCGTTHMMAPELFDEKLEENGYSYEVDVWAFGILAYELFIGY